MVRFIGVYLVLIVASGLLMTQSKAYENTVQACASHKMTAVTLKDTHYCVDKKTHKLTNLKDVK